jgi:CBS domain-containing protein
MVASFDSSLGTPPLAEAIDRNPLIVMPDVRLSAVAVLMHETTAIAQQSSPNKLQDALCGARASCVLVMQDGQLLGIFTERDLVQLTALGVSLADTQIAEVMHYPVLSMTEASLHNVFAALFLFRRHHIRHLAIVNDPHQLIGVVSLDSIRHILRPTNLLKIRRVAEVMTHQVIAAFPHTSVLQIAELMATHHISCIVIVEQRYEEEEIDHPVGIITERDIVHFQALGLDLHQTHAQAVMSTPLFVLSPEDSLWTAHQEMEQRQVRRLVVSWNWGKSLGIVTQTSLLRVFDPIEMHGVIETLQHTIQRLGIDPNQVLADSIDHDIHLSAPFCSLEDQQAPGIHELITALQSQISYLLNQPEIDAKARQVYLSQMLSALQTFQHNLK